MMYPGDDKEMNLGELNEAIREAKELLQKMFTQKKTLIEKLGNAYEKVPNNGESICERIKNVLKNEINEGLISSRLIEKYCPDKWKKKTKPKKEKQNENLSFAEKKKLLPVMMAATDGSVVLQTEDHTSDNKISDLDDEDIDEIEYVDNNEIKDPSTNESELYINGTLEFEHSFPFDVVQKYMADEFNKHKGIEPVWIHGTLNKFTGRIICLNLGKIPDRH